MFGAIRESCPHNLYYTLRVQRGCPPCFTVVPLAPAPRRPLLTPSAPASARPRGPTYSGAPRYHAPTRDFPRARRCRPCVPPASAPPSPAPPSPCKSACLPSPAPTPSPPLFPHGLGTATATPTMLCDHRPCSPHPSLYIVLLPLMTPLASLASFAGPTILASSFCLSLTPPIAEHHGEPSLPSSPLPPLLRLPRMPPPLLSTVAATVPLAPVRSRSGMTTRLRVATRRNCHCAHTCPIQPPWSSSPSSPWQELSSR